MKILITESQITPLIEKLIKSNIPNVVSVNFKNVPTSSYGDDGVVNYDDVHIQVVVDPAKVFECNIYTGKGFEGNIYPPQSIYKQVSKLLKNYLDIDVGAFRSGYGLDIFIVTTSKF